MALVCSVSLADSTDLYPKDSTTNPSERLEAKKEQRFERSDLKGPRAKNHPTHAYKSSKAVVAAPTAATDERMGPAAKNYRPWQDDTKAQHVVVSGKEKKDLKGPRAKNHKPWNNP